MSQEPDILLIEPFDRIKRISTCCRVIWEAVALFFILLSIRSDIRELEHWHCISRTKFHGFTSFDTVHVVFALCQHGKVLRQESCSNFAGFYSPDQCCVGTSWSDYDPILRHAKRLCVPPLSRLFFHLKHNVEHNRSEHTVQADDRDDSRQLVDPRQIQISISQSFRKLLVFRQSSRKRKAMKHSRTDHNKSVQSWRLTQRICKAASGLHACVRHCSRLIFSLSASAQCFFYVTTWITFW